MKYRADIDGLRALAVLPVVFFHAGFGSFSGGFVGVDIFFVISGFLITSIIIKDLQEDKFSIRYFYERRIRRIIPALYTVCLVSAIAAYFIFLPNEFTLFGKSLTATLGFVSNILFWSETGYFDASAELKPLLHTWSLAVEEQFYVLFPLFLLFLKRVPHKTIFFLLLGMAIASLLISVWGSYNKPSATFYWAPTRAWELLIGSLLALGILPKINNKMLLNIGGIFGLGLITYAVFLFDYDTVFPGFNAVFPCLGTALLIYCNQNQDNFGHKLLSLKPLVFIGLCSYSFYLWHWPVFVFANYLTIEHLSFSQSLLLILLSFCLSVLTWKYIETPFRSQEFLTGKWRIFIIALLVSIPLLLASVVIVATKGLPNRFDNIKKLEEYRGDLVDSSCLDIDLDAFEEKRCVFGDQSRQQTSFIVWGDSHAGALVRGIGEAEKKRGKSGYLAGFNGCIPLLGVLGAREKQPEACNQKAEKVLAGIKRGDTVYMVARWTYYTRKSLVSKEGPTWINDDQSQEISEVENYRVFKRALNKTINLIQEKGAKPVLVDLVPEFSRSVPEAYYLFKTDITVDSNLVKQNRKQTSVILKEVAKDLSVSYIDPLPIFCDEVACYGTKEGEVYFSDNDHVNLKGSEKLIPLFQKF